MFFGWTTHVSARHTARVGLLIAFIAAFFNGAPAWATAIQSVNVHSDSIVIRFDDRVGDASSFVLGTPRRIAVDVAGAQPGQVAQAAGPVRDVRQGRGAGNGARIVFDLSRPAIVTSGDFDADGRTLTLSLADVDDAGFDQAAARGRTHFLSSFALASAPVKQAYSVKMPVPAAQKAPSLPRVYGDSRLPLVVIDPGHGGQDPGAIGVGGLQEKDLTLKIAEAIKDQLLKSGRVRVALTREDDRFVILRERFAIARKLGGNLFISIHCDSANDPDATGATAYTLSEVASDKEAARLAARENKADLIAGVDLDEQAPDISSLLIDLTQRQTMNSSAGFARLLGREAETLVPEKTKFHRMASLMVLKALDMPSILFETGYISNPKDAAFLASTDGRQKIADSVADAVEIHFAKQYASR